MRCYLWDNVYLPASVLGIVDDSLGDVQAHPLFVYDEV